METRIDRRRVLAQLSSLAVLTAVGGAPVARATAADLRTDVEILRQALALHPGLHRYAHPREVSRWIAAFTPAFLNASDEAGRYLSLSALLARIRCGHTYPSLYNQSRGVVERLFERPTRLPLEFRWVGTEMVVTRPYPGMPGPVAGSRIERLNGMPTARLLGELMRHARADGHNDGKRRSLLSQQGEDEVETFDVFQSLLCPPVAGVHQLAVRTPAGGMEWLALPAVTFEERRRQSRVPANDGSPYWHWEMRHDGVAVLTMPGWAMYSLRWKGWQSWLRERLDSLAGARALLIDLRANEGGEDVGDVILRRLAPREMVFPAYEQRVRFRRTPAELDPYLDTWDDSFRRLGEGATELGDGFLLRPDSPAQDVIRPEGPRLALPVGVLIGPANSSATFQFAQRVQASGLATLIGQPTGGNRRGINGGCFFFVRLPASGLEFDLPLVGYFPRNAQPDAGIEPDIRVSERWQDLRDERDVTLETALGWARRA